VYFAGENTLYAVDLETGEVEWEFENPAGEPLGESNPAVKDGTVYVLVAKTNACMRSILRMDLKSGQ